MQHDHFEESRQIARCDHGQTEQGHSQQNVAEGDRGHDLAGRSGANARPQDNVVEDAERRDQSTPDFPKQDGEQDKTGCQQNSPRLLTDRHHIDFGLIVNHWRTFTGAVETGTRAFFLASFCAARFGLLVGCTPPCNQDAAHRDLENNDDEKHYPSRGNETPLQLDRADRIADHGNASQQQGSARVRQTRPGGFAKPARAGQDFPSSHRQSVETRDN